MILFALQVAIVAIILSATVGGIWAAAGVLQRYMDRQTALALAETQAECDEILALAAEKTERLKARTLALRAAEEEVDEELEFRRMYEDRRSGRHD